MERFSPKPGSSASPLSRPISFSTSIRRRCGRQFFPSAPMSFSSFEYGCHAGSQVLDGGKPLSERLKNLHQRHAIVKSGSERSMEIKVPTVREPQVDFINLLNRSRGAWGRSRVVIERAIAKRQAEFRRSANEVIDAWE